MSEGNGHLISNVNANRNQIGEWEKFLINDLDDGDCIRHGEVITINAGNNWYWRPNAKNNLKGNWFYSGLVFNAPNRIKFKLTNHSDANGCLDDGDQISLQSIWTNKYVVAEPNGKAKVNRSAIGAWEKITVEIHEEMNPDPEINFWDFGAALVDVLETLKNQDGDVLLGYHAARSNVPPGDVPVPGGNRIEWGTFSDTVYGIVKDKADKVISQNSWDNQVYQKKDYFQDVAAKLLIAEIEGDLSKKQEAIDAIRWVKESKENQEENAFPDQYFPEIRMSPLLWRFEYMLDQSTLQDLESTLIYEGYPGGVPEGTYNDFINNTLNAIAGENTFGLLDKFTLLNNALIYGADNYSPEIPLIDYIAPLTENLIIKRESSRYLNNKWKKEKNGNTDKKYDNAQNGMDEFLTQYLDHMIKATVYEYNSRSYAESTIMSLLNLEAYAEGAVQTKARQLLDQIMFKYAIGSFDGNRWGPMRRKHTNGSFGFRSDDTGSMIKTQWSNATEEGGLHTGPGGYEFSTARSAIALWTSLLDYRIPEKTLNLALSTDSTYFATLGRGKLTSPDLFSAGPGYLLSAGGVIPDKRTEHPACEAIGYITNTVAGASCSDQVMRATTLQLEGLGLEPDKGFRMSGGNQEINLGGGHVVIVDEALPLLGELNTSQPPKLTAETVTADPYSRELSYGNFNNTCVYENFACSAARVWIPTSDSLKESNFSMHCEDEPNGVDIENLSNPTNKNLNQWCVYSTGASSKPIRIAIFSRNNLGVMAIFPGNIGPKSLLQKIVNKNDDNTLANQFTWPSGVGAPNGTISYNPNAPSDKWAIKGVSYAQNSFNNLGRNYEDWPQINLVSGDLETFSQDSVIRIELENNFLQLQEVEVKISGQWHFLNSNSFSAEFSARDEHSSAWRASNAGDGKRAGRIYHSRGANGTKWWQASLTGLPGAITKIRIKTRADQWGHRINGAKVYFSGQHINTWDWDGAFTKAFAVPSD